MSRTLKPIFQCLFVPWAQKSRQQSATAAKTQANVRLVENVGFVPGLAPATTKLDMNHGSVIGFYFTETGPSSAVVALNAVLNHGHVEEVQLYADEAVDTDATVRTDRLESFDKPGEALDSTRHSQINQHDAAGSGDGDGTDGASNIDSAYHFHDSHDLHRPAQEIHLSSDAAIEDTVDPADAYGTGLPVDVFDDTSNSSIDWDEYMITSANSHKSNVAKKPSYEGILDSPCADQDGYISPVYTYIHDSYSATSVDEAESDEAESDEASETIITATASVGSDDSDQQSHKDGVDCYDESDVLAGPGTSEIESDYDGVIASDLPDTLDSTSSCQTSTNGHRGNNAPESGQMSDERPPKIDPVTTTHDPAGPDTGYLHIHEDGVVADHTLDRTEPQQKRTILPPFSAPQWCDDEEGDMWEEAFEELNSAPEETFENTQKDYVLPLHNSTQEEDDTWVQACYDQIQCPNETDQDNKNGRNDVNPTLKIQAEPKPETNPRFSSPKYNHRTPEGRHRLGYIKWYMSLSQDMQPSRVVLYLIQSSCRTASLQAAWTNPAFLRACLELDWRGVQNELPWPTDEPDEEIERNWSLVQEWLDWGGNLLSATDCNNERLPLREEEWCVELTWGELLEHVWHQRPRDRTLVCRHMASLNRIEDARGCRAGHWEGHGPSRLGKLVLG